jgi:hypothetical protein
VGSHFLPIFYRAAESGDERARTKVCKVLIHVVLVLRRLCSLASVPACHAGGRGFESPPLRHSFLAAPVGVAQEGPLSSDRFAQLQVVCGTVQKHGGRQTPATGGLPAEHQEKRCRTLIGDVRSDTPHRATIVRTGSR